VWLYEPFKQIKSVSQAGDRERGEENSVRNYKKREVEEGPVNPSLEGSQAS